MSQSLRDAVGREYEQLAPEYDTRWSAYVLDGVRQVLPELPSTPGLRLLDVGCGTGALLDAAIERQPDLRACGVDLSGPMLRRARARLQGRVGLVCADAGGLPFRDAAFDAVVSSSSLHYWPDPAGALREIARVLRPDGRLVLVDWNADHLGVRLLSLGLRLARRPLGRVLRARELEALLRECGFFAVAVRSYRAGRWGMMTATATRSRGG